MAVFRLENLDELVRDLLNAEDETTLRTLLADQYAQDVADVLERLDEESRLLVFKLLDPEFAAEVLAEIGIYTTRWLLEHLPTDRIIRLFAAMPIDDVVEILAEDVPQRQEELIKEMAPERAKEISEQLNYPAYSAGRLMTRKFARIKAGMTVEEAMAYARQMNSKLETLNDFYILDAQSKLEGVVSLRDLVIAHPTTQVAQIMEREVISVLPESEQEQAARTLGHYDFLAIPVVTPDGRMLGIITADDAMDVLTVENTEDILKFGGATLTGDLDDQPYFTLPMFRVLRQRFMWLLLLFLADTLTGNVLRLFEGELAQVVALSFYIPLLIGTGGNTGAQTVSTIIRGMAVHDIKPSDAFRVVRRELSSGLILGTMLGAVGLVRAYIWDGDMQLALVIGITLVVVCTWANTIGSLIPILAKRFGIDPAVVSAPLITTLVDATGLLIYLSIARLLLDLS